MRGIGALAAFFVVLPLFSVCAQTSDTKPSRQELNDLQYDFTECAVYFRIAEEGVSRKPNSAEETRNLSRYSKRMKEAAMELGDNIGISSNAVVSRFELVKEQQVDMIDGDLVNISVLINKYNDNCASMVKVYNQLRDRIR